MGLVAQVFSPAQIKELGQGSILALGHTRYSTTGSSRAENAHPGSLLADVEVAEEDRGKTRGLATDEGDQCSHLPAVPPARAGQVHVPDVERAGRCREAHAEGDAILERQVRPRKMMHAVCDDGERRQDGAALFEIERRRDGAVDARAQVRGECAARRVAG